MPGSSETAGSAAESAQTQHADGAAGDTLATEGGGGSDAQPPGSEPPATATLGDQRIRPEGVQGAAQGFASGQVSLVPPRGSCALVAAGVDDDLIVTQFGRGSERALILIDEAQNTYRLVSCDTGALITKGGL